MPRPEITRERLTFAMNRKVKWRKITKRKDSFGREYIVWIDRNNLEPLGQIERHFTTPVVVPDEYLKFPEERPWFVDVRWEDYALYLKDELRMWQAQLQLHMKKLYGAMGVGKVPTHEALELAGQPPQDWRLVVLAARGDAYLLGFQKKPTAAALKLLPELAHNVPTAKAAIGRKELQLDAELEALYAGDKAGRRASIKEDPIDPEATAARARAELADDDESDLDAQEDADLARMAADIPDDDDGILVGSAGADDEELGDIIEESADPGAIGGTRVRVGSEKSRASSKGRTRKTRG